ncbi:glucosamine-6-phosphate deaminase [Halalkalibacter akibai]|uniref:Glucosamine-6-phosphate deaminase n=1 Tax=Halalkalibacter akibai (strain ATCC 43226 / DSM 21942 / CIP 109018 / JCM 9157 / 1139) TaxID=1236973 RepID=W4QSY6_HALA3|nr:glucosamine-6-phosphate deaminase [Halalkalibacter akibai]GAE35007.1 glucosamine-6-phosphate deaminase [Halalkalibacter akibai JCM 9157]
MNLIEVRDYEEMSQIAADYLVKQVRKNPASVLGLATGGTPQKMYELLIADHKKNKTNYNTITTFNLDEYMGLKPTDPTSYRYYMDQNLFNHINVQEKNINLPSGLAANVEEECKKYEVRIQEKGGIDLQILGIGSNGHIGFNEPRTAFSSRTHVVNLTASTREANARFFDSIKEVPTQAITMGIATIMESKEILLLVSGEEKADAMKRLFSQEEPNEQFPASILKNHPHVTIVADKKALKGVVVPV